jgi:anti-sigma factor RsiW
MSRARDPYLEWIEEYLDDDLPEDRRAEIQAHIRTCPECLAEVDRYRRLRRLALAVPPVPVPDDLGFRIRKRLEAPMASAPWAKSQRSLRRLSWVAGLAAAAAILLLLLPERTPPPPSLTIGVRPKLTDHVGDWFDQARNATPEDVPFLAEEARELDLLASVRERLGTATGEERRFLTGAEDLLVQLLNDPSAETFPEEARLVAMARRP